MRNRNNYDRTGSSQDFSNNEGYHDYQDFTDHSFRNPPHFADRQRSQYGADMYRSPRNDYRSDYFNDRSDYRADYRAGAFNEWNRPTLLNADRYESMPHHFSADYAQRPAARQGTYNSDQVNFGSGTNYGSASASNWGTGYGTNFYEGGRFDSSRSSVGPERRSGMHAGKGPKGYRRSDERIREDASEALRAHSEIDASEIEVDVKDGIVTLSGTVDSRQVKRMAEDTVEGISGVNDIKNDLHIMASIENYGKGKTLAQDLSSIGETDNSSRSSKSSPAAGRQQASSSASSASKSVQ